jgi:hypothetical protein
MGPTRGWNSGQELNSVWQTFDSLSLKKTGDNKFRVDVQYLEKDTKTNTTQPKKYEFRRRQSPQATMEKPSAFLRAALAPPRLLPN